MTTIKNFENSVWRLEKIRIVVRADSWKEVEDYDFSFKAMQKITIAKFVEDRIMGSIGNFSVEVVDGYGSVPNGNSLVGTVRDSYRR